MRDNIRRGKAFIMDTWRMGDKKLLFFSFFIAVLIGWNFWLPKARGGFSERNRPGEPPNLDFFAYYLAGRASSLKLDPYADNRAIAPELISTEGPSWQGKFVYPPTFLPIYSAIATLQYNTARKLWAIGALGIHFIALLILVRQSTTKREEIFLAGLVLTLTSHPLLFHLRQGQVDLYVSSLILLSFITYLKKSHKLSALFLSIAFLLKINPILLLVTFLFFFRDRKYLGYFGASTLFLVLLSLLFMPANYYVKYFAEVLPSIAEGSSYIYNQSIFRLFNSWQVEVASDISSGWQFAIGHMNGVLTILLMTGLAFFFEVIRKRWARENRVVINGQDSTELYWSIFFMNIVATLLFTSRTWHMSFVWVILPMSKLLVVFMSSARYWFTALIGLSFALMNSVIIEEPWLDSLNMIGALLALILLAVFNSNPERILSEE